MRIIVHHRETLNETHIITGCGLIRHKFNNLNVYTTTKGEVTCKNCIKVKQSNEKTK